MCMTILGQDLGYYFTTNSEGVYFFQAQHDWSRYSKENFMALFKVVLFYSLPKIGFYFIYFMRMMFMAVLTMIGPIIVIINAFTKMVYGNKYLSSKARNMVEKRWSYKRSFRKFCE